MASSKVPSSGIYYLLQHQGSNEDLALVAITGNYSDLNGLPDLTQYFEKTGGNISGDVDIDGDLTLNIPDDNAGITLSKFLDDSLTNDTTILVLTGFIDSQGTTTEHKPIIRNVGTPIEDYDVATKEYVDSVIAGAAYAMVFKGTLGVGGTISSLPTAAPSNIGFTYKVITAGTYASQTAKVGDLFISNGTEWVWVPSGDEDDTWRIIKVNGTDLLGNAISTGAVNFKNGTNVTITGSGNDVTISATDTNQKVKAGNVTFGNDDVVNLEGDGIVSVTGDATNDKITISASHQSIKTLKTDNTTAQSTNASEAIAGNGTLNLHKVAKTGTYSDLIGTPTIPTVNNAKLSIQGSGTTASEFTANASTDVTLNIKGGGATTVSKTDDNEITVSSPLNAVSSTYSVLRTLRNSSGLVPGQYYRITDYQCTTIQDDTQAASNLFDIIVRADDVNVLNENAYAAHHEGDTYFQNSKLESWQLKYCLDNDTDRFAWADSTNGKGVVYYMKDEWNNECPYDFKNIQFKRWAVTENQSNPDLEVDSENNTYGYYYGAKTFNGNSQVLSNATYGEDYGWFYTFALKDLNSEDWYDYTVIANIGLKNDEENAMCCYDNHLSTATDEYNSGNGEIAKMLNDIVFFNVYGDISNPEYSDVYSYCNNNRFDGNCHSNTFGSNCNNNTFGYDCYNNTFGNNCIGNTFGNYCYSNTFRNDCYYNTFGNNCNGNTFGNNCNGNTFGNDCYNNTFGNNCYNNTFGNHCNGNTFGNNCNGNTFGNDCYNNTFGNYIRQLTVFNGVHYCSVDGGTGGGIYVQNVQILNGVQGVSVQNKLTITFEANKTYTQVACMTPSGGLKIFKAGYPIEILDLTD